MAKNYTFRKFLTKRISGFKWVWGFFLWPPAFFLIFVAGCNRLAPGSCDFSKLNFFKTYNASDWIGFALMFLLFELLILLCLYGVYYLIYKKT